MVGEIRDTETAELAVQAALTGHLVLSTLHTNSASASVPRLVDMGLETYLLAPTLQMLVGQRLPRTICPHCVEAYEATESEIQQVMSVLNWRNFDIIKYLKDKAKKQSTGESAVDDRLNRRITSPPPGAMKSNPKFYLYRGKGCEKCQGTGYGGRTGIFEVLPVSERISKMILDNSPASGIQRQAEDEGMVTMLQDGFMKAIEAITTIDEVLRVARE